MTERRIINLNGGDYIKNIEGDYIEGKSTAKDIKPKKEKSAEPKNYIENLKGEYIVGDVTEVTIINE